jgi:hypothetical protein
MLAVRKVAAVVKHLLGGLEKRMIITSNKPLVIEHGNELESPVSFLKESETINKDWYLNIAYGLPGNIDTVNERLKGRPIVFRNLPCAAA